MEKDFDIWNDQKKKINLKNKGRFYRTREIWWCMLGFNVGYEQNGVGSEYMRPILILRGLSRNTCLVIPLSSSPQVHPMRIPIGLIDQKNTSVIISQLRVIDTRRLVDRILVLEPGLFETIRKAVKDLL